MKTYIKFVFLFFMFAACYGFAVPSLLSAKDSVYVFCGFVVAIALAPLMLILTANKLFKKSVKKDNEK